jgi:hypothetical protein
MQASLAAGAEAVARTGGREELLTLAGLNVRVKFAGDRLKAAMTRAFAHVRSEPRAPLLDLTVWDSAGSGVTLPVEAGSLASHVRRGLGQVQQEGTVLSLFEGMDQGLSMLDLGSRTGLYWLPDAGNPAEGDRAAPLRTILNWFLPTEGRMVVHAAALATPAGAVLLFGKSGSGKSTTALACVQAGFAYLGDDFCALTMDDAITVHCLYCSGKTFERHLDDLPGFASLVTNPDRVATEKAIGYLDRANGVVIATNAKVRAAVILAGKGACAPQIERITPARALRSVAPSTMLNLPGPAGSQLAGFAALARRVPCFEMHLAEDIQANPQALRLLLQLPE